MCCAALQCLSICCCAAQQRLLWQALTVLKRVLTVACAAASVKSKSFRSFTDLTCLGLTILNPHLHHIGHKALSLFCLQKLIALLKRTKKKEEKVATAQNTLLAGATSLHPVSRLSLGVLSLSGYVMCLVSYVVCCDVMCCMLWIGWYLLHVVCCLLYVACCMLSVVCCMLYVVCCLL